MALRNWFRPQATRLNRPRVLRPASRLRVETLEDRTTPSGGALDPTFGTGGIVTVPAVNRTNHLVTAVQPDGKILSLVTASLTNSHGVYVGVYQPAIIRLNSNGTVDTTFGTNGTVNLPLPKNGYGTTLAVAPDGKILVGAQAYVKTGDSDVEFAVARLTPAGALDTSFGNSHGWWLSNPSAQDETVLQLATVPAVGGGYSVIVGGTAGATAGQSVGSFAVAKLTPAGLPDPTFGTNGLTIRKVSTGVSTPTTSMAVTASGEVVFTGRVGGGGAPLTGWVLVGFTPAGQPDVGFGTGGVVPLVAIGPGGVAAGIFGTFPGTTYGMNQAVVTAQGNSLIVVGSVAVDDPSGAGRVGAGYVIRYNSAGTLDSTFGTGGVYYGPASLTTTGNSVFYQVAVGADGSIALAGWGGYNDAHNVNHHGLIVGHLTADGHADPGFGTAGTGLVLRYDQEPSTNYGFFTLCIDPNGNLLVGLGTIVDPAHSQLMRFTVA